MRRLVFFAALASATPLIPRIALAQAQPAQVSDADRAAARDLFFEGVKLQNDGKFADALDRFQRAQRIFSAPTQLLHIAECQVALNQLVEGAETYRTLVRTPLPPGSPAAFTQAQQQGAAELSQVEPRIPTVKVDVTPANLQGLQVTVDDAPMNSALVGVSRPIDPGQHKIDAFAPGYRRLEATFTIKERDQLAVPMALQPGGPSSYPPPPVVAPAPYPTTAPGAVPPPPPYQPTQPLPGGPEQPGMMPVAKPPSAGFLVGVTAGPVFPAGGLAGGTSITDVVGPGGAFGIDAGIRFATHFGFFLGFDHAWFGSNLNANALGSATGTFTSNNQGNDVDLRFVYMSNPNGAVGFYGDVGLGYRWLTTDVQQGFFDESTTYRGAEFKLGGGLEIKGGSYVRIIPKVTFGIGSFNSGDFSCTGEGCPPTANTSGGTITNTATHTFVFLGVAGYFNKDFGGGH